MLKLIKLICFCILLVSFTAIAGCQEKKSHNDKKENDIEGQEDTKAYIKMTEKSNNFGFKVINQLNAEETNSNTFISPVSLYMALSMLYPGAEKETKEEMTSVLELDDFTVKELNEANFSLLKILNDKNNEDTKLNIANSLWLNHRFQLNESYEKMVKKYFDAELQAIDGAEEKDVNRLNEWASEKTNGKIDKIAESPLEKNFVAMLVNTVYFNGNWSYPFNKAKTKKDVFYLADGTEEDVSFMKLEKKLNYVKHEEYEAVNLPYGEDGKIGMYLYLPTKPGDLRSIHEALQQYSTKDLIAEMNQTEGKLSLPKFKLDHEQKMNEILETLGMEQAFNKKNADFPNIIDSKDPLHISEIKHMTYIDINEEGTEAAGSTNAGIETTSLPVHEPFDMKLDHPFVMLIADEETGTILFMGDIYDVSE